MNEEFKNKNGKNPFLKAMTYSCGLVIRTTEDDFLRLLETLQNDFPRIHLIYQKFSVAPLWIKKGYPDDNSN
jgi:hypothetical protein